MSLELIERIAMTAQEDNKKVLFLDEMYNDCLIGSLTQGNPVYSFSKIIKALMKDLSCDYTEALEFFDFNVLSILVLKEDTLMPVVVYDDEAFS